MDTKLTKLLSPNSSDQSDLQLQLVKSIPGYIQLLKDLDDSEYDNLLIQKYSKASRYTVLGTSKTIL